MFFGFDAGFIDIFGKYVVKNVQQVISTSTICFCFFNILSLSQCLPAPQKMKKENQSKTNLAKIIMSYIGLIPQTLASIFAYLFNWI